MKLTIVCDRRGAIIDRRVDSMIADPIILRDCVASYMRQITNDGNLTIVETKTGTHTARLQDEDVFKFNIRYDQDLQAK